MRAFLLSGPTRMNHAIFEKNNRIIVIDDNRAIHDDFRKILCAGNAHSNLDEVEAALFGDAPVKKASAPEFQVDSAYQGKEGVELVRAAIAAGRPYAMAFVDMRMPADPRALGSTRVIIDATRPGHIAFPTRLNIPQAALDRVKLNEWLDGVEGGAK